MATVNFDKLVIARMLEFFGQATPWQRGLWTLGICLSLEEILEAARAHGDSALGPKSLSQLGSSSFEVAKRDPVITPRELGLLSNLNNLGKRPLLVHGIEFALLRQFHVKLSGTYLTRWADLLGVGPAPGVELTARSLAAHLLDAGFNHNFLHRWLTFHKNASGDLLAIILAANDLLLKPQKNYEMLIPLQNIPSGKSGPPTEWKDRRFTRRWLAQNGFTENGTFEGSLIFNLVARDPESAAIFAMEQVEALSTKVLLGTEKKLRHLPNVWIVGSPRPYELTRGARRVQVKALFREDKLGPTGSTILDAALGLLGHLETNSPSVAVAAGWAAIESILSEPNDRGAAADQIARIVACSFPRHELTSLSYRITRPSPLVQSLKRCTTNHDRARLLGQAILNGDSVEGRNTADVAALNRQNKILANPFESLLDIEFYLRASFRRLYRQRNYVLHWGKTDSVVLRSCIRTVAPLVGAGMDRIAHAVYVDRISPRELAARSKLSLMTLGNQDPLSCCSLLG